MVEYLLIVAAVLVVLVIPGVRAGSRRHRDQIARDDSHTIGTDSGSSVWTFSDSSSAASDSGSCSSGDSSSGGDCGSSSSD